MDDQELENTKPEDQECWGSGFYETGATRPPKNYGGLLALLLTAGIILAGVINSVGMLRADRAEPNAHTDPDAPDIFSFVGDTTPAETQPAETTATGASQRVLLELHDTPEAVENIPQEGGLSLQTIYEKNIDSVVSVSCTLSSGTSGGSGVVLSRDGFVVTNAHVVEGASSISVLLTNGTTLPAAVVGADALSDLAVLRVEAQNLTPAEFGDSASLRVGDAVAAIGDPLGITLRGTLTNGIVSAINRDITTGGRTMTLIQTNAALNSGNSGGPLLNCYGQVIGINTMKMSSYVTSTAVEGLGFAIPSATVKEIVDQLMSQGYVSGRPSLGLQGEDVSSFYQGFYHLPAGVYVTGVVQGGSAQNAGLAEGDILLYLDGVRISSGEALQAQLYTHQVGDTVTVIFYRSGRQLSAEITLDQAK